MNKSSRSMQFMFLIIFRLFTGISYFTKGKQFHVTYILYVNTIEWTENTVFWEFRKFLLRTSKVPFMHFKLVV